MKQISEFLDIENISVAREKKESGSRINPLCVKLVDYVFAKFFLLCRGADELFSDEKRTLAEKTQWQTTFTREGLTSVEHIRKALLRLEKYQYPRPPQLGEFLKWNEQSLEDFGLIPKEQAYHKACDFMREGDHLGLSISQAEVIDHAIKQTGRFDLRNKPESQIRSVFERNYEIAVRQFIAGELAPIPKAIQDKHKETIEEKKIKDITKGFEHLNSYEEAMPEIRKMLGMKVNGYPINR